MKVKVNFNKGIIGVFNIIWKRRKYSSFHQVFSSNYMTVGESIDIHSNLRKTWMRTAAVCLGVILIVWGLYYINRGILTLSLSIISSIICTGLPITLFFIFNWIEHGINKHISRLSDEKKSGFKKDYDDFNIWLGI
jgi:hypothetical protein